MPKDVQLASRPPTRDRKDVLTILYQTWRNDSKGQKIIGAWIGGLVIASIWGIYIKRRLKSSVEKESTAGAITRKAPSSFLLKNLENSPVNTIEEDIKMDREISSMSRDSDDLDETPQDLDDKKTKLSTFRGVLDIAIPSVFSSPILWSTLLSTSLIWKTSNVSSVNDCIGSLGELLVSKKWKLLSYSTMDFAIKTVYASLSFATVKFLSDLLRLSLRDNLTSDILGKYGYNTDNISYLYNTVASINNMDHRICNDVDKWSICFVECFVSLCKPIIDVTVYCNKLRRRIGVYYLFQCIFYFLISSLWTRCVLPSYGLMKSEKMSYEALFAEHNKRIIHYIEEIHFLRGIAAEINILNDSYYKLYNFLSLISVYDGIYTFFQNYIVRYIGILSSFISLLPMIRHEKSPTEFLLNNLHDLVNIGLAFRDLMKSTKQFEELNSISVRIIDLSNKLEDELHSLKSSKRYIDDCDEHFSDAKHIKYRSFEDIINDSKPKNIDIYKDDDVVIGDDNDDNNKRKQCIIFKDVRIETPDQRKLILNKFNFEICAGKNVLICGENGVGKSSLIRCISGLWNINKGKMKILIQNQNIYYLPSRSYLIPNLSIKQQLLYPDIYNENNAVSDESIIEILNDCGLGQLLQYIDDINDTKCIDNMFWSNLSDGESQLICLCRPLLLENIKIVFIDESFSNLHKDKIHWFYNKLSIKNITAITVTHNINNIKIYHDVILTMNGDANGSYHISNT